MNKHEEIKLIKHVLDERCIPVKTDELAKQYFNELVIHYEATEKAYEELKRDVKRFMELYPGIKQDPAYREYRDLFDKLSNEVTSK